MTIDEIMRTSRVIPVLVEGAVMPRAGELPDDLKSLVRRHAIEVRPDRFRDDSERLIGAVQRAVEAARAEEQRKCEGQERVEAERRTPRQNETAALEGIDAGSRGPPPDRAGRCRK